MARPIAILLLVSSAAAFPYENAGPEAGGAARRPASVVAAVAAGDEDVCGECPWPQPQTHRRQYGALPPAVLAYESAGVRPAANEFPRRGRGPTLASLSDSLILSRPPPAVPACRAGSPAPIDANRSTRTRRNLR